MLRRIFALISLALNAAIVFYTVRSVMDGFDVKTFRYFTTDSNILCAVSALCVVPFAAYTLVTGTDITPRFVTVLKFCGTCAVTVTMLTVYLYLGPNSSLQSLLSGAGWYLHLINPVLALISMLLFDGGEKMPPYAIVLGFAPVIVYGMLYFERVIIHKKWLDFYGFNRTGHWQISMVVMFVSSAALSAVMYLMRNFRSGCFPAARL